MDAIPAFSDRRFIPPSSPVPRAVSPDRSAISDRVDLSSVDERAAARDDVWKSVRDEVKRYVDLIKKSLGEKDEEGGENAPAGEGGETAPEGRSAERVTVEVKTSTSVSVEVTATSTQQESDPLTVDLNGDGRLSTSGVAAGAAFDIDGDGALDRSSFVTGGDAFLARDVDGDGVISSGKELFGDQTGAANGYASLAALDDNGDGVVDGADRAFDSLRLVTSAGEGLKVSNTLSLTEAGIAAIRVAYADVDGATTGGDRVTQTSTYTRTDGTVGVTGDVLLRFDKRV